MILKEKKEKNVKFKICLHPVHHKIRYAAIKIKSSDDCEATG